MWNCRLYWKKASATILVGGLRRPEYRGYDSAGIATLADNGEVTLLREKGKVTELEERSLPIKIRI